MGIRSSNKPSTKEPWRSSERRPALSQRATTIVVPDSREALARLAATFYGDPSRRLKVIGVTGTNGKSTTTFLVKHLLERANQSTGLIGTVQYEIGERRVAGSRTTPESLDLQELLSQCVEAGCRNVVLEVSSHALSQGRANEIEFDVGAFTNLTQDHLDFHHGMKDYFEAKMRLFESVRESQKKERAAVVNIDDPYGQQVVARFGRDLPIITYGMGARAEFRASNFKVEMNGTSYQLNAKEKSYLVRLPLIGRFNIYNSLAALAVAHAIGADLRNVGVGPCQCAPDPGTPRGGTGQAAVPGVCRLCAHRRCVVECRQNLPRSASKPADSGLWMRRKQG